MKDLLLNPINLTIIVAISGVYLFIALYFSSRNKGIEVLEKFSISFFIFLLAGSNLFYLSYLNPSNFSNLGFIEGAQKNFIIAQFLIYLGWIAILRKNLRNFPHSIISLFSDPFLGGLLFITLLSASWSQTPIVTLIGSIVLVAVGTFAAHIARRFNWSKLADLMRWGITWIGLLSLPVALILPSVGRFGSGGWNGILLHKNTFGALMALGAILWYIYLQPKIKRKKLGIGIALLLAIEVFLSTSGGAITILLVLSNIVLSTQTFKNLNRRSRAIFIIFLVIFVIPGSIILNSSMNSILGLLGKDANLTGRTDFWPQVVDAINQRPLLGYGYMGFWQGWRGEESPSHIISIVGGGFAPEHPHNGFLDLGTSLGYIGLTLLLLSILKNFVRAMVYLNKNQGVESALPLLLLLYVILRNLSETGLWRTDLDFFFYVLLTVRLNLEMKQAQTSALSERQVHQNA